MPNGGQGSLNVTYNLEKPYLGLDNERRFQGRRLTGGGIIKGGVDCYTNNIGYNKGKIRFQKSQIDGTDHKLVQEWHHIEGNKV